MKTKGKIMPTAIIDNVEGTALPPEWLKKTGENPDQIFEITIRAKKTESSKESQKDINKWERFADEIDNVNFLGNGVGDYFLEQSKEFRKNFTFNHDSE